MWAPQQQSPSGLEKGTLSFATTRWRPGASSSLACARRAAWLDVGLHRGRGFPSASAGPLSSLRTRRMVALQLQSTRNDS